MFVIVGTGGGTYHSMAGLRVIASRLGEREMRLFDGDLYEERNGERQAWNLEPGSPKVTAAVRLAEEYGFNAEGYEEYVEEPAQIVRLVDREKAGWVFVMGMADSDVGRKVAAEAAWMLSAECPLHTIVYATGGNDTDHGHGIAARAVRGAFPGDAYTYHPDVFGQVTTDDRETWDFEKDAVHCGDVQEQTMLSNMRTAQCMIEAVEAVVFDEETFAEIRWSEDVFNQGVLKKWRQR